MFICELTSSAPMTAEFCLNSENLINSVKIEQEKVFSTMSYAPDPVLIQHVTFITIWSEVQEEPYLSLFTLPEEYSILI